MLIHIHTSCIRQRKRSMGNLYSEHYIKPPESHCYSTATYPLRAKKGAV